MQQTVSVIISMIWRKESGAGLDDYREYVTEKATVEELKQQNSYFINALYKEDDVA